MSRIGTACTHPFELAINLLTFMVELSFPFECAAEHPCTLICGSAHPAFLNGASSSSLSSSLFESAASAAVASVAAASVAAASVAAASAARFCPVNAKHCHTASCCSRSAVVTL